MKVALLLGGLLPVMQTIGRADEASVVTAANTLLTTSTVQTSPYALTTPVSVAYTLTNDKKWTNLAWHAAGQQPQRPRDWRRAGVVQHQLQRRL